MTDLIDKYFPVHDYGFISLKDVMGDDSAIVQAARVSYGEGTKKKSDDTSLINYLMMHDHGTPFEMVDFKFHIGMPIFTMRQLARHRISSTNETSYRYSVAPLLFYSPRQDELRKQSATNKQGSSDEELQEVLIKDIIYSQGHLRNWASDHYKECLEAGLARELARIDLPLSTYTYFYWKINLRSLFNFLKLRLDFHAQKEIRDYAKVLAGMVKEVCPVAFAAFERYELYSVKFTQEERQLIWDYSLSEFAGNGSLEQFVNLYDNSLSKREKVEFIEKMNYKPKVDYTLDYSLAKSAEHYERLIKDHAVEV